MRVTTLHVGASDAVARDTSLQLRLTCRRHRRVASCFTTIDTEVQMVAVMTVVASQALAAAVVVEVVSTATSNRRHDGHRGGDGITMATPAAVAPGSTTCLIR